MDQPLVSIIVPIYMIDRYLGICVESLLNQTYQNLEIILVDDGSKDRCPEICDLYASKDSRLKVVHKENGGLVSARKAGLEVSTGGLITYVDGDDWVGPDYIEKQVAAYLETGADMVCAAQTRVIFDRAVELCNSIPTGVYEGDALFELQKEMLSRGTFYRPGITTYVWNKLFRRSFIIDNHLSFIPGIRFQDIPFTHECYLKATKCIKTNLILNVYRRGHFSASAPNFFNMEKAHDLCTAIATTWELTKSEGITPEAREAIIKSLLTTYYNLIYRLLKYINKVTDRVKVLRFLYTLAPDLRFSNNIKQRIGSWVSRKAPRQYLAIQSVRWKKSK